MWKRAACQTLSQALDISSDTVWVASDLLKSQSILSDKTVRRSVVDWEDPNHTRNQKKGHISVGDQQFYYLQVFQRLY